MSEFIAYFNDEFIPESQCLIQATFSEIMGIDFMGQALSQGQPSTF